MNQNVITEILTLEDINKQRLHYLEKAKQCEQQKLEHKKNTPLVKRIWYRYIASKRVGEIPKKPISEIKRVLIFRHDALGDYIQITPIISFLKKNNPNIIVDVATSVWNDAFVRSDKNVSNTYIVAYKGNNYSHFAPSIKVMQKNNYDIIFCRAAAKNTKAAELAYRISKTAHKICFASETNRELYEQIFDTMVANYVFEKHHCELEFEAIKQYFGSENKIENYLPYIPNVEPSHERQNYVICNLTGKDDDRVFSVENAVSFIKPLSEEFANTTFYISGSPDRQWLLDAVVKEIGLSNVKYLSLPFNDFVVFLANAKLLISPDTAPTHIAAAVDVPTIAIFNSVYKVFDWHPYQKNFRVVLGRWEDDHRYEVGSINNIDTAKIVEATKEMLYKI